MTKTIWLILFGVLAVLALALFLLAARNWSKASALYSAPTSEEPPRKDEGKGAPPAPAVGQPAPAEGASATRPAATPEPALPPSAQQAEERA
jgi:hypothetical protein